MDQPVLVDLIYNKSLQEGFFIEAGAWDGKSASDGELSLVGLVDPKILEPYFQQTFFLVFNIFELPVVF